VPSGAGALKFSVVIPTRDRPRELAACLESIAGLEYPYADFEVIVVDDGGDLDASVLEQARQSINVRLLKQQRPRGPASARNRGVAAAHGQYIAFTDDDCIVDPGWLRAMEAALESNPDAMVGGTTLSSQDSSLFAVASQNVLDFLYDHYASMPSRYRYFATNNLACRRDAFRRLGGFDESFPRAAAEDRDLCERWNDAGRRFHQEPSAVVTHHVRSSFTRYVAQHFRYGRGADSLMKARERRGSVPPREPAGFFARLIAFPLRQGVSLHNLALAALAAMSQAAYGAGYYVERTLGRLKPPTLPTGEPVLPRFENYRRT
jgi:GT2 family glycosyltransferase